MTESLDVQLARLQENLKYVIDAFSEDRESRKEMQEKLTKIELWCEIQDKRMLALETQFAKATPTIEEFITIKQQVLGAGKMGRFLWVTGGILIGLAYSAREWIRSFLP